MRSSIAILALFLSGCMHVLVGVHPLINVTAKIPEGECTPLFQDDNNDGICDEWDFYLLFEDPVGERWAPLQHIEGEGTSQRIRVDFFADYKKLRDHPVDCNGNPIDTVGISEGDTISTSYFVFPVAFSEDVIVNNVKWSTRLSDGNKDTQGVEHTVLEDGSVCLTVSSVYFSNIDAANLGVP